MPKNDEGEFELILGNRQLISVFLIVVILLGVFFSMGYIVGRNSASAPVETARNERPRTADSQPDTAPTPDTSTPPEPAADSKSAPASSPVTTQPEQPAPAAEKPAPAPKETKEAKEVKPKPTPAPPPPAPAPAERATAAGQPGTGDYWQVVATARPDAEIIAEAINKKGLHAILAPAPKDGVFRVLVGPLEDAPTQAKTRTALEAAGFKNPILRKY